MKKLLVLTAVFFTSVSIYAQTCPSAEQIVKNGRLVVPPGWEAFGNTHVYNSDIGFMIAGWGDHYSESAPVNCYYFDNSKLVNSVYLRSTARVNRSNVVSHQEWRRRYDDDDYYYTCGNYNGYHDVNTCPYN